MTRASASAKGYTVEIATAPMAKIDIVITGPTPAFYQWDAAMLIAVGSAIEAFKKSLAEDKKPKGAA